MKKMEITDKELQDFKDQVRSLTEGENRRYTLTHVAEDFLSYSGVATLSAIMNDDTGRRRPSRDRYERIQEIMKNGGNPLPPKPEILTSAKHKRVVQLLDYLKGKEIPLETVAGNLGLSVEEFNYRLESQEFTTEHYNALTIFSEGELARKDAMATQPTKRTSHRPPPNGATAVERYRAAYQFLELAERSLEDGIKEGAFEWVTEAGVQRLVRLIEDVQQKLPSVAHA